MADETARDWTVLSGTHQTRLRLASHVRRVRPGTPLRPSARNSWEISPTGTDARWLAAHNETGGNEVDVWKAATFATYTPKLFGAGDTLKIDYIDDDGRVHLVVDPEGKIDAIDNEKIYVSVPLR
jgi:hypothetical protein